MSCPLQNLGRVLGQLGHKVSRDRLQWPMQLQERPGHRVQERVMAKRGRYDLDDMGQYRSATPSVQLGPDDRQGDGATFSVLKG